MGQLCTKFHIHAVRYGNIWFVQYIETDLRTLVRNQRDRYTNFEKIKEILASVKVNPEQRSCFDEGQYEIRSCLIDAD